MNNEGLILNRLLEIQEDLGSIKTKQDALEEEFETISCTLRTLEKNCGDHAFIQISKKQLMIIGGSIITAIAGYLNIT